MPAGRGRDVTSFLRLFAGLAVLIDPEAEGCRRGGGGGTRGFDSIGACEGAWEGKSAAAEEGATGCTFRAGGGGGGWGALLFDSSSALTCSGVWSELLASGMSEMDSCALRFEALLGLPGVAACRLDAGGGGGTFFGVDMSSSCATIGSGRDCCGGGTSFAGTTGGDGVSDGCRFAGGGGSGLLRSLADLCIVGLKMPLCCVVSGGVPLPPGAWKLGGID